MAEIERPVEDMVWIDGVRSDGGTDVDMYLAETAW
jgi:hypothetical protein